MTTTNLMQHATWSKVVRCMFCDQGMDAPTDFDLEWDEAELELAEKYLSTLSSDDLQKICIGDADDEMAPLVHAGGAAGETAHRILDEIFMQIGG